MKYEYAGVSGFSAPFHRRGKEGSDMEEQNRKKITLWIRPDILSRMDGWLESDNCKSRGEFTEKALRFYMGHLSSEDTSEYLSKALVSTLRGIEADNENRMRNAVFVGKDENGVARHAHKRSTNTIGKAFRLNVEGSDPKHSFHHIGTDGSLYVFEAPIDLLSYITLHPEYWQEHTYVACCGTSALPVLEMLSRLPNINTVYLCLDNDKAGHTASKRMEELLADRDVTTLRLTPNNKDWNEDLVMFESEVPTPCLAPGF